jgi:hypothetical protein
MRFRKMKRFWQVTILLVLTCLSIYYIDDACGQPISGFQIKADAIQPRHLGDSLDWVFSIRVNDSTVLYCNIAKDVVAGILTSGDFTAASLDSIKRYLVERADTADVVISVANGAISDTNKFASALRDGLFGRNETKWIYYTQRAQVADSTPIAAHSYTTVLAESSLTAPHDDTTNYAWKASVADFAYAVLGSDTISVADTATYAVVAGTSLIADSLSANAIDAIGMFTSAMQAAYLTTASQNAALDASHAPSGSNRILTDSDADSQYVKVIPAGQGVTIGFKSSPGADLGISVDSMAKVIEVDHGSTELSFPSQELISAEISDSVDTVRDYADSQDEQFIQRGDSADFPGQIHLEMDFDPATLLGNGEIGYRGSDSSIFGKIGSTVHQFGGSGSGGAAQEVSVTEGTIDADSLLILTRNETFTAETLTIDNNLVVGDELHADTLSGLTDDTIWVKSSILPNDSAITSGDTSETNLGSNLKRFNYVYGDYFFGNSAIISGAAILGPVAGPYTSNTLLNYGAATIAGNLSTYGNITPSGSPDTLGYVSSSTTTDSYRGFLANLRISSSSTDYLTIDNGSNLSMRHGEMLLNSSDFHIYSSIGPGGGDLLLGVDSRLVFNNPSAELHFSTSRKIFGTFGDDTLDVLSEDQNKAMDYSCPTPGYTNPVATWYTLWANQIYPARRMSLNSTFPSFKSFYSYYTGLFGNDCQPQNIDSVYIPDSFDHSNEFNVNTVIDFRPRILPWQERFGDANMLEQWTEDCRLGMDTTVNDTTWVLYHLGTSRTPAAIGEFVVGDQYNDSLGMITGYFNGLQAALDSIPNFYVKTKRLSADSVYLYNTTEDSMKILRYGLSKKDSVFSVPTRFLSVGSWFCATGYNASVTTDDSSRTWVMISKVVNDSLFLVSDQMWATAKTNQFGVIATQHLISVEKPRFGNVMLIEDTLEIHKDVSPVVIKGRGEGVTIIGNMTSAGFGGSGGSAVLFYPTLEGPDGDCGYGLPITISDMSINADTTSTTSGGPIWLSGRASMKNVKIVGKADHGTAMVNYYEGSTLSPGGTRTGSLSMTLENVKAIIDTGITGFATRTDSAKFSADNCYFSYGGADGRVYDQYEQAGANPHFHQCVFYADAASRTQFAGNVTMATDSILVTNSTFLYSTMLDDNNMIVSYGDATVTNNYENASITNPPAQLDASTWPFQTGKNPK